MSSSIMRSPIPPSSLIASAGDTSAKRSPSASRISPRQIHHVAAHVAVLGEFGWVSEKLLVAGEQALVELVHLIAGVVDVVLALDVVSRRRQHVCECAADDRAPRVRHV